MITRTTVQQHGHDADELVMPTSRAAVLSGRSTRTLAGGVAVLAGLACVLTPVTASARSSAPATPTGLHVVRVSPTSFTVTANAAARHYRLYASTVKGDLATDRLSSALKSRRTRKPTITLHHLPYSTSPYYYRIVAMNGSKRRYSATAGVVGLKPATPANVVAHSGSSGTSISWTADDVTGFTITQATDPAMTRNLHTYTTSGEDQEFTPYGLTEGTTYYFQVRALNNSTASDPSPVVSAVAQTMEQPLSVMTYNVLEITGDGRSEGGNTVAPWSQRRVGVANFINSAAPDVVSIQEGAAWVGAVKGPRQIDDIESEVGRTYSLAATEIPPSQPHYFRTGVYILYKTAAYAPVGAGGHWALGENRFAAYQELENRTTGAKFLFVAPHLRVQNGRDNDLRREAETKAMVTQATAFDATINGVPVVYAGDFNSDVSTAHPINGPTAYMLPSNIDDAFDVAQSRTNAQYDTANQYMTRPPTSAERIDYVFAPAGVAVSSWTQLLNLSHGEFTGVIPSDHNPVVANLEFPYQPVS